MYVFPEISQTTCAKIYQSERRLYALREQLKVQFRATQKAQVNERKASESKRRLTSYVFHEVRVPLNTARGSLILSSMT
jgi:signal transduction histidine kinase